jgi:hypothetical protein
MSTWPRSPDDEPAMRQLLISLDVLTPRERRDLANSLLRAAWCAALEETRILLLDLMLELDDTIGSAE